MRSVMAAQRSRAKLGVAILIPCHSERVHKWIHSHIAFIEGYLNQFKCSVESAIYHKDQFYHMVNEATLSVRRRLTALICEDSETLRQRSTWMQLLVNSKNDRLEAMKAFATCLARLSSRELRFLSLAVSSTLTHHLSWVNATTSLLNQSDTSPSSSQQPPPSHSNNIRVNKLWAQLCEVFAVADNPPKCNRIVVHGKNQITGQSRNCLFCFHGFKFDCFCFFFSSTLHHSCLLLHQSTSFDQNLLKVDLH